VEIIGSLVRPNIEKIILMKPDIVFYSREDMAVQVVDRLTDSGLRTYCFERNADFIAICNNYIILARIIGRHEQALEKISRYRKRLEDIKLRTAAAENGSPGQKKFSLVFFISHRPLIVASGLSYIGKIIKDSGAINCYDGADYPYPVVSMESLVTENPDIILSMDTAPGQFFRDILDVKAARENRIYAVKPDPIAYYSPRDYVDSVAFIAALLYDLK
jgi:iron complex transport system substrate-binding protein